MTAASARATRTAFPSLQGCEFLRASSTLDIACRAHLSISRPLRSHPPPPPHSLPYDMSRCQQVARPLVLCLRPACSVQSSAASIPKATARLFSNSPSRCDVEPTTTSSPVDAQATQDLLSTKFPASAPPVGPEGASTADQRAALKAQWLDPNTTTLLWAERKLQKQGINPIGSRRRRAAVRQTQGLPFEQLPYHAYQEARKLLAADRLKKLEEIKRAYQRLKTVEAQPAETYRSGTAHKNKMLYSLRKQLWYLKIQADINDPAVRMKWEDGLGKPRMDLVSYCLRRLADHNLVRLQPT